MTIDASTAAALDALALSIHDPQITPSSSPGLGNHWGAGVGLKAQDDATDAKLAALIAPLMLAIDGRTLATGFKYTLNITNALQLRPKHWFMQYAEHDGLTYGWPANIVLNSPNPTPGVVDEGAWSWGGSLGLAACAAICKAWAQIVRLWLAGNYPLAVSQPGASA
jgi:hypothetical protein